MRKIKSKKENIKIEVFAHIKLNSVKSTISKVMQERYNFFENDYAFNNEEEEKFIKLNKEIGKKYYKTVNRIWKKDTEWLPI